MREKCFIYDALNTFYLQLYGVRHMVKDHSDSEKGNLLPPHRLLFPINSKGSFICTIPQTGLHIHTHLTSFPYMLRNTGTWSRMCAHTHTRTPIRNVFSMSLGVLCSRKQSISANKIQDVNESAIPYCFTFTNGFTICHLTLIPGGARCSSVVRAFAHGAMGRRIDSLLLERVVALW